MARIAIDQNKCTRCGACVALCSSGVFSRSGEAVQVTSPDECWLCGHCVAACPPDAITHQDFPLDACPGLAPANLPAPEVLLEALRQRRSTRVFRDRPVPRDAVQELVSASRWHPSASNSQPVDWLAFDDPRQIASLSGQAVAVYASMLGQLQNPWYRPFLRLTLGQKKLQAALDKLPGFERLVRRHARGEDPIFRRAPVVLVPHVPAGDYFGRDHAACAALVLSLAAERLGLGTCQVGYFTVAYDRSRQLRQALGLPPGRRAQGTLLLGYPVYRFHRAPARRLPDLHWPEPEPTQVSGI